LRHNPVLAVCMLSEQMKGAL